MSKKLILVSASFAVFALGATTAFAEIKVPSPTGAKVATSTSATPVSVSAKIACVGGAVHVREAALSSAIATFTDAEKANYLARSAALTQAYTGTTTKSVVTATRAAWSTFTTNEKSARKTWQTARDAAWKSYRTTAVACKAPAGTGDGVNSDSEASGT